MGEVDEVTHSLGVAGASWFDLRLAPDAVHFGVPSLSATIVLALDRPTDVGWAHEPGHHGYRVLVAGLHTRPSLVRTHGRQHGLQLALTPRGCRALLGLPIGAVSGHILELDDLPAAPLHDVLAPVRAAPAPLRPTALRAGLLAVAARLHRERPRPPRAEVVEAWRLLTTGHGGASVDDVARTVGWSRRHLSAQFAAEVGLRPKEVARIARLTAARALASAGQDLATVAATTGYADQSHLTREWTAAVGRPPARSLRAEFPNLQDLTPAHRTGSGP
ncbi:AraC family transcriptional regulator [Ruania suaedae]|uniref:helix-turn-helix domain-containing protein n=1 Tax=Ruania suaedae TaxID=2897774 RepID=UPI001E2A6585|nr:AraC family transcriptional regulator [Ruania suaedae]UFU01770.1 AraC family transcriptional regulator [Ruania suaedae]